MNISMLCFNIHKGSGWNIRHSTFSQLQRHLVALQTDLVFFQEVRGSHFESLQHIGWPYAIYGKNAITRKGHHGNAILSKFPVVFWNNINISMHRYEKRGLLHVVVQLPHHKEKLHLLCVHLGLFINSRKKQLALIVHYINTHIPKHESIILSGDFNDWRGDATKPLVIDLGFEEAFLTLQRAYAKTFPAWAPMLRLDRVYFRGLHVTDAVRLTKKPWRYLSDHVGVWVSLKWNIK